MSLTRIEDFKCEDSIKERPVEPFKPVITGGGGQGIPPAPTVVRHDSKVQPGKSYKDALMGTQPFKPEMQGGPGNPQSIPPAHRPSGRFSGVTRGITQLKGKAKEIRTKSIIRAAADCAKQGGLYTKTKGCINKNGGRLSGVTRGISKLKQNAAAAKERIGKAFEKKTAEKRADCARQGKLYRQTTNDCMGKAPMIAGSRRSVKGKRGLEHRRRRSDSEPLDLSLAEFNRPSKLSLTQFIQARRGCGYDCTDDSGCTSPCGYCEPSSTGGVCQSDNHRGRYRPGTSYESDFVDTSESVHQEAPDPRWGLKLGCDVELDGFQHYSAMGVSTPRMNGAYKVATTVTGAPKMVNGKKSYYGPNSSFGAMIVEWFPDVKGQPGWVMRYPNMGGYQPKDDWLMYCHTSQNLDQLHGVTGTCTWKWYGGSNPSTRVSAKCCEPTPDPCDAYKPVKGISQCAQYHVNKPDSWCSKNPFSGAFKCCVNNHHATKPECVHNTVKSSARPQCKAWF
jgi:hypothetical protein